jgi:aspartate aminotransferase, cytoplasmic
MSGNLATLPELPRDEAFAITADFNADDNIHKVSLGAGVYRDEKAKPWVLSSVKEVSIFSSYYGLRNCEG